MRSTFRKLQAFGAAPRHAPWLFLAVAFLAYGLFLWRYGFYWDDLPMSWIRYQLGPDALRKYFSTARPVWAELYILTTSWLPQIPIYWQIFSLLWRWLGVVLLWSLVRELWPNHEKLAVLAGLFFLLYPGFNLQWVSFLTTHFYIVICFFFLSYLLMLWALKTPNRYWLFTVGAMVFSALNLWMLEYFYFLELIRAFILFYALYQTQPSPGFMQVARRTLLHWLPYLVVFIANLLYRALVFTNVAYQNVLLSDLRANPVNAILGLIRAIASDIWVVLVQAWARVFIFPSPAVDGPLTTLMYVTVVLLVGLLTWLYLFGAGAAERAAEREGTSDHRPGYWMIGLALIAVLLGGGPYWLATLEVNLSFPASRFTMSFMLGLSLLLAGLVHLLPSRARSLVAILLIALAAGRQVLVGDAFRRDGESQKNLFWQMKWRAPGMRPHTLVLMNEELSFYADNSIGGALNWIYSSNRIENGIELALFYPTNRLGRSLPGLEPGLLVHYSYIAGDFNGNTSDTLAFYYDPPACLRLLDPDLDGENRFILDESLMREAAALSNPDRILREPFSEMPEIYYPEPEYGWCYYFQQAELARQFGDWREVVHLGNQAFTLDDSPNNPVERFVFIEGHAHIHDWERAVELSRISFRVSKDYVGPLLCKLWSRIEAETIESPERSDALDQIRELAACSTTE
jgi:hypothetical protein